MKKILIVDDDVKTTPYLVDELTDTYDYDVTWLKNADNVIETIEGSIFDAIVLDIMMPIPNEWTFDELRRSENGMSTGLVLLEKIRSKYLRIPIIIYSAKRISITDEFTYILRKPELSSFLVDQIKKMLSHES